MSLTKATYSMIQGAPANVLDFGADPTGSVNSTAAFDAAFAVSKNVFAPPGTYLLENLSLGDGYQLIGAGYENTIFKQNDPGEYIILVQTTGPRITSIVAKNFQVQGATSPTAPAVVLSATSTGAIWKSVFDFVAIDTYQAMRIFASPFNNVYANSFKINSNNTLAASVVVEAGTYNEFDLFLTECMSGEAYIGGGINNTFIRLVADGQIVESGLNTTFINPTVEYLQVSLPAGSSVFNLTNGKNQTLINPTIILPDGSATKTTYGFKPGDGTTFVNPSIINIGVSTLADPFDVNNGVLWTLIGGKSNCTNKMEVRYDDFDAIYSLRNVAMVGDVSEYTDSVPTHGGKIIQYLVPTNGQSIDINSNTDAIVLEPAAPLAGIQLNLVGGFIDGRVISFSTTENIAAITWVSSGDVTELPVSLTAAAPFSIILSATNAKAYLTT